jgi:hypothetical protein
MPRALKPPVTDQLAQALGNNDDYALVSDSTRTPPAHEGGGDAQATRYSGIDAGSRASIRRAACPGRARSDSVRRRIADHLRTSPAAGAPADAIAAQRAGPRCHLPLR